MKSFKSFLVFFTIWFMLCSSQENESSFNDYIKDCNGCEKEIIKDEAGNIKWEISTLNNNKHGLVKSWWPNGKLSSEKYYKDGKIHGPVKMWDENGNLITDSYWRDGKCVKK